jgi:hypothetical protein
MARIKRKGDRGSPYRGPLLCCSHGPQMSLGVTEDEEVVSNRLTQFRHRAGNPRCCIISRRYAQDTKLNALVISSFRSKAGVFLRW